MENWNICPYCSTPENPIKLEPDGSHCFICPVCFEKFGLCED